MKIELPPGHMNNIHLCLLKNSILYHNRFGILPSPLAWAYSFTLQLKFRLTGTAVAKKICHRTKPPPSVSIVVD